MAEFTYPLDGEQNYTAAQAGAFNGTRTSGVWSADTNLQVAIGDNRTLVVSTGQAWFTTDIYWGKTYVNTSTISFAVPLADATLDRIVRIVIEWNKNANTTTAKMLTGTLASMPIAPAISQTDEVYDLVLADYYIPHGEINLNVVNLTDQRLNEDLCGVMRDAVEGIPTASLQTQAQALLDDLNQAIEDAGTLQLIDGAVSLPKFTTDLQNEWANFIGHIESTSNPHGITAEQIGAQKAYTSLEQIGLTVETASSYAVVHNAMPLNSTLTISWTGKSVTGAGEFGKLMPEGYGSLVVRRTHISTWRFQPYNSAGGIKADLGEYCGNYNNINDSDQDSKWSGWARGGHPVGSVYMSLSATSPAELFGGTWERIQDRFLLAAGSSYAAGAAGGEDVHELVNSELPYIGWLDALGYGDAGSGYGVQISDRNINLVAASSGTPSFGTTTYEINKSGSNKAHNNMPPYLAVYAWKRTA